MFEGMKAFFDGHKDALWRVDADRNVLDALFARWDAVSGGLEMVMEDEGMEGEEDEDEEPVEDNSLGHARESASAASCFYFLRE